MEFKQDDYVLGFWFGSSEKFNADFLLTALKRGETWHVEYRFRYHVDNKVVDSKDVKNFHGFTTKCDEDKLMAGLLALTTALKVEYPDLHFVECRGDVDKAMYTLAQQDFTTIRKPTKDELREIEKNGT